MVTLLLISVILNDLERHCKFLVHKQLVVVLSMPKNQLQYLLKYYL